MYLPFNKITRIVAIVLCGIFLFANACHAQRMHIYGGGVRGGMYRGMRGGHRNKVARQKKERVQSTGTISVSGTEYQGKVILYADHVVMHTKKQVQTYNYTDTALHSVTADLIGGKLQLVRVAAIDNHIWRMIKDTMGVRVMDKQLTKIPAVSNIDFHNLVFAKDKEHRYASGGFLGSTKNNMIKVMNQYWNIHLDDKNFADKQDVIARIIGNDKSVYPG